MQGSPGGRGLPGQSGESGPPGEHGETGPRGLRGSDGPAVSLLGSLRALTFFSAVNGRDEIKRIFKKDDMKS